MKIKYCMTLKLLFKKKKKKSGSLRVQIKDDDQFLLNDSHGHKIFSSNNLLMKTASICVFFLHEFIFPS